ncbi:MAG: hypothetical protein WBL95_11115 [Microcoleus sp.]
MASKFAKNPVSLSECVTPGKNRKKCDRIKHFGEGRSPFTILLFLGMNWQGDSLRDSFASRAFDEFMNVMFYFARISAIPQVSLDLCLHVDRKLSRYPG